MKTLPLILIVPTLLLGCASIVAPGQTREDLEASGATRWVVTEYDCGATHYVWIPHWAEGALHVSTPHASNVKKLDVLEFKGGKLIGVEELGSDRDRWVAKLREHGRLKSSAEISLGDPLHDAVAFKIIHPGAPIEAVLFAAGFPSGGPNCNPKVKRTPYEIKLDDELYYLRTTGGAAQEVVIRGGRVTETREAQRLSKDWIPFYHPVR